MNGTFSTPRGRVSLVVPTRDRCALLSQTLDSFRKQSYSEWEAIVVDDGSTDDTIETIAALSAEDPRIRLIRRDRLPQGAQTCRNIGISAATGAYVIFFDSDDLMARNCLERRVRFMEERPELDFAVFQAQMFETAPGDLQLVWNSDTGEDHLERFLQGDPPWCIGSSIWRREVLQRVGRWDEELLCSQDQDYHTRALLAGLKHTWIPEVDVFVRTRQASYESIGTHWTSPQHMLSQWVRTRKLTQDLRTRGRLHGRCRSFVAGNYFWIAVNLIEHPDRRDQAFAAWAECRTSGLVSALQYGIGRLYLNRWRRRGGPVSAWLLYNVWPDEMFVFERAMTRDTPIRLQTSPVAALEYARRHRLARRPPIVQQGLVRWMARRLFGRLGVGGVAGVR